jgi:RNA polymerase-binding transcription factor DksA
MTTCTPAVTASTAQATDWAPFQVLLETQRAVCIAQHEMTSAETVASTPDLVALRRAATLLRTVEEIDAALDRIDAGTYGRCVHCGSAIPLERLEFRPFAAGCVSCQESAR